VRSRGIHRHIRRINPRLVPTDNAEKEAVTRDLFAAAYADGGVGTTVMPCTQDGMALKLLG